MSYETVPDTWVIVRVTTPESTLYKVLAGFYGGYTQSDEWRLNSGIARYSFDESENAYLFEGYSGSVYRCYKNNERFTGYTSSIYESFRKQISEKTDTSKIEHIDMEDFINEFIPLGEYDGQ